MNFSLIGAAGFVAPRHMRAIRDTGHRIVSAVDPSDSVGILDSFSHDIAFFTEFERYERHAEELRRRGDGSAIDYVSICSPNYLHDAHIRFALRTGAHAICEKPLVLDAEALDGLAAAERESGRRIYNVLQLRLHPAIAGLRERVLRETAQDASRRYRVDLSYITSRGAWYFASWKGDRRKSGGVAPNIGVHFFDMLLWIFGPLEGSEVTTSTGGGPPGERRMAGRLRLARADVEWFLSVDRDDLPAAARAAGQPTFRSITVDDAEIEFSGGFTDLHTAVYRDILAGGGYGLEDARAAIELVSSLA